MSQSRNSRRSGEKQKNNKKPWGLPCVHTLPTGAARTRKGEDVRHAENERWRACDSFGNACFSTGTAGFILASVVINNLAMEAAGYSGTDISNARSKSPSYGPAFFLRKRRLNSNADATTSASGNTAGGSNTGSGVGGSNSTGAAGGAKEGAASASPTSVFLTTFTKTSETATDTNYENAEGSNQDVQDNEDGVVVGLVDAHCHLSLPPLCGEGVVEGVVRRAREAGVSMCGVSSTMPGKDWERVRALHQRYPDFIVPAYGLHPYWVGRYTDRHDRRARMSWAAGGELGLHGMSTCCATGGAISDGALDIELGVKSEGTLDTAVNGALDSLESELRTFLAGAPMAAVGECGLDKPLSKGRRSITTTTYATSGNGDGNNDSKQHCMTQKEGAVTLEYQEAVLRRHLDVAADKRRPVVLHCVGCWGKLLQVCTILVTRGMRLSPLITHSNSAPKHRNHGRFCPKNPTTETYRPQSSTVPTA